MNGGGAAPAGRSGSASLRPDGKRLARLIELNEVIEMGFSELREKEVINICDGKHYGHPIDIELNEQACAVALVVPSQSGWKSVFRSVQEGVVIPWSHVRRIGDDVILVELDNAFFQNC